MLLQRLLSSIVLFFFLFLIFKSIFFLKLLLFHTLSIFSIWEFFRILNLKKRDENSNNEEMNNILLTRTKNNFFEYTLIFFVQIILFLFHANHINETLYLLSIVSFFLVCLFFKDFLSFVGCVYLTTPFFFLNFLNLHELYFILTLIFIITISSDVGGYIFGKSLKGPKLIRAISPNKTWSGFLGAIFFSISSIFLFTSTNEVTQLVCLTIFFSVGCQTGDIIESYVKRKIKIKNSGGLIPGHGGILDRLDSFYLLTNLFMLLYIFNFDLYKIFDLNI